jgi:hypothetical protein
MTYEDYRKEVIKLAVETYGDKVCADSIKESYLNESSIQEAVEEVLADTAYWDNNWQN